MVMHYSIKIRNILVEEDFSKAYNKIFHQRLLGMVRVHGKDRKVLDWIR